MERSEEPSLKRIRASTAVGGRDSDEDDAPDEKENPDLMAIPEKGEASSRDSPDLKRMRVEGVSSSDSDDEEEIDIVAYMKANHIFWSSDDEETPEILSEEGVLGEKGVFVEEVESEEQALMRALVNSIAKRPGKPEVWKNKKKYVAVKCDSSASDDEEVFNTDDLIVRTYQKLNLDEEETEKILKRLEENMARLYSADFSRGVPDKPLFFLSIDSDGDYQYFEERSLDIYYQYLFPNTPPALRIYRPFRWNKLPEVDFQYELLYDNLDKCGKIERGFLNEYIRCASREMRRTNFCTAKDMAKRLKLTKLCDSWIHECLDNLFLECDVKAVHKFKEEYDMFLLECRYNPKLQPKDFKSTVPPVGSRLGFFPEGDQLMFDAWINEIKGMEMPKEACQKLLKERHEKNLREDLSTRIRYVRYKRSVAKTLGLIRA